ncbi:hypothetical protein T8833_04270 [Staphylococcus aureus]|nr:hypothetical protein FPO92_11420 [Staphylococcus aureus]WRN76243.1 hypothetical protein T8833_04270 [Staphylococcus aureus]
MVTKEFLKTKLECSDMYAQKLIDEAQGDENKLYDLFIQKLAERHTRPLSSNIKEC